MPFGRGGKVGLPAVVLLVVGVLFRWRPAVAEEAASTSPAP